jgi:hypothetical protein
MKAVQNEAILNENTPPTRLFYCQPQVVIGYHNNAIVLINVQALALHMV